MRINTNVSALNAQRQLGITNAAVSQSITRLSSGFRINRAADDAGGLGIANKLRGDIRSMTQAARNGEQANSLAQIAEGAVSGIAKMLDRMKELATQANSDTVDNAGRERLQAEFSALRDEINRTAATTQFGQTQLINGGFGTRIDMTDASTAGTIFSVAGVTNMTSNSAAPATYTLAAASGDVSITVGDVTQTLAAGAGANVLNFSQFGITIETDANYVVNTLSGTVIVSGAGGEFMVGSSGAYSSTDGDLLQFEAVDTRVATLGIGSVTLEATTANAQAALTAVDGAIGKVNEALGKIGAFQNRVENAVANLKVSIENLSASESVIRDLDMASEMTVFSRNQILQQAGTAMLAQANQSSQTVLQLLRG